MKYFVMDILACPVCKSTDLLLHVIEESDESVELPVERVKCKRWCHYKGRPANEVSVDVCRECVKKRIRAGVIVCKTCGRWYPIIDTIAVMLDDEYRDEKVYSRFLEGYLDKIPLSVKGLMKIPELPRNT